MTWELLEFLLGQGQFELQMLYPDQVRDYVVLYEPYHWKELNHSPAYWDMWSVYGLCKKNYITG